MTSAAVAEKLGMKERTVGEWARLGLLTGERTGKVHSPWLVDEASVDHTEGVIRKHGLKKAGSLLRKELQQRSAAPAPTGNGQPPPAPTPPDPVETEKDQQPPASEISRALGILADHPDWTKKEIAKAAKVHPVTLSKNKRFCAAFDAIRASARGDLPRARDRSSV
jgi:hypothetical protein